MKWPPSPGGSQNWARGAPKELQRRRGAKTTPQEPSDRSTKTVEGKTYSCIEVSTCSKFRHSNFQHVRIFNMFEFCDLAPSCRFHLCSVHVLVYGPGSQNLLLRVCSVRFGVMLGGCSDVAGVHRYACFLGPVWGLVRNS